MTLCFGYDWKMPICRVVPSVTSGFLPGWRRWHYGTDLGDLRESSRPQFNSVFDGLFGLILRQIRVRIDIVIRHTKRPGKRLWAPFLKQLLEIGQEVKARGLESANRW